MLYEVQLLSATGWVELAIGLSQSEARTMHERADALGAVARMVCTARSGMRVVVRA
jgi:hypothetical protein